MTALGKLEERTRDPQAGARLIAEGDGHPPAEAEPEEAKVVDAPGPDAPFLRKLFSKKDDPPGRVCPELVIISAQDSPRYRRIGH